MTKKPQKKAPLVRKLDNLWSQIVRAKGSCERCGSTRTLQCAHNVTRSVRRLRWDERNLMCLCAGCHRWWHNYPMTAAEWFTSARPADAAYIAETQNERTSYTAADYQDFIEEAKERLGQVAAGRKAA